MFKSEWVFFKKIGQYGEVSVFETRTQKLPHKSWAISDGMFIEQGAMRTMSAQRLNSMCNIGPPILLCKLNWQRDNAKEITEYNLTFRTSIFGC